MKSKKMKIFILYISVFDIIYEPFIIFFIGFLIELLKQRFFFNLAMYCFKEEEQQKNLF